jgi:hypothetical protein
VSARIGGMGAVAPMVAGRRLAGWSRRGQKPWPVKLGPARPGQQSKSTKDSTAPKIEANKRGGRSWNAL